MSTHEPHERETLITRSRASIVSVLVVRVGADLCIHFQVIRYHVQGILIISSWLCSFCFLVRKKRDRNGL